MKPILSGTAALIVGTLGGLALAASVAVPAPWGTLVGLLGFIACVVAGVAAPTPRIVEGKPILQGGALTAAIGLGEVLHQFYGSLPTGWPQGLALGGAGLLAWLTGRALPPLSASQGGAAGPSPVGSVETLDDAAKVLSKGPNP